MILIVEEAHPLSDNETPLMNQNSINVDCRKSSDDLESIAKKEETETHSTKKKKLAKYISNVGRQMINLEMCIVDIGNLNHDDFDILLSNISKGQLLQSGNCVNRSTTSNIERGLKYLHLMNLSQSSPKLATCVFRNLRCLIIESLWKSYLDVCSFFRMIDECRMNVESSRGGKPKLFIKLRCYVQYGLVVKKVTDPKPTCDIWKDWFFNGLIDFCVDCRSVMLDAVEDNILDSAYTFKGLVSTADYFGNVLNGFRDKSGWAARLKERYVFLFLNYRLFSHKRIKRK